MYAQASHPPPMGMHVPMQTYPHTDAPTHMQIHIYLCIHLSNCIYAAYKCPWIYNKCPRI